MFSRSQIEHSSDLPLYMPVSESTNKSHLIVFAWLSAARSAISSFQPVDGNDTLNCTHLPVLSFVHA